MSEPRDPVEAITDAILAGLRPLVHQEVAAHFRKAVSREIDDLMEKAAAARHLNAAHKTRSGEESSANRPREEAKSTSGVANTSMNRAPSTPSTSGPHDKRATGRIAYQTGPAAYILKELEANKGGMTQKALTNGAVANGTRRNTAAKAFRRLKDDKMITEANGRYVLAARS